MEMPIRITYRDQTFEVEPRLTLLEVLAKIDIDPEMVLAICGGEMIGGDTVLEAGDEVRLVSVISEGNFYLPSPCPLPAGKGRINQK